MPSRTSYFLESMEDPEEFYPGSVYEIPSVTLTDNTDSLAPNSKAISETWDAIYVVQSQLQHMSGDVRVMGLDMASHFSPVLGTVVE